MLNSTQIVGTSVKQMTNLIPDLKVTIPKMRIFMIHINFIQAFTLVVYCLSKTRPWRETRGQNYSSMNRQNWAKQQEREGK